MKSNEDFLASVDLPAINPPPNWTGFTLKNAESPQSSLRQGVYSRYFLHMLNLRYSDIDIQQKSTGEICVSGFKDGIHNKYDALRLLLQLIKEQPQVEIVFAQEPKQPKSPSLKELVQEGIKAIREKFFRSRS